VSETVLSDPRYAEAAARLWPVIRGARRIISPFHINSDPDAVGSALGMAHILAALGKEVLVYASDGDFPAITAFLPGAEGIVRYRGGPLPEGDLILALDSSDLGRLGALAGQNGDRFAAGPVVMIDHHVTNSRFGIAPGVDANFIDSTAAATAEMVFLLAQAAGLAISTEAATCLLAGIYGDTLGLQTSSTSPRTLRVAAELRAAGADLTTIANHFYRERPFSTIKLWGVVLARAAWCGEVVWSQVTPEMIAEAGAEDGESGGIISFLSGAIGARVTVLMHRGEHEWRVGLRTQLDAVNVAAIAEQFGGGGHRKASGCRIPGDEAEREAFLQTVDRLAAEQVAGGAEAVAVG
jgi:bifunctional oligoribonuclease and PAP phosphatase NrnA